MINRLPPLESGRDTEIDMIEREMEGGVVVIQPLEVQQDRSDSSLGGLVTVEEHVDVREIETTPEGVPKV